MGGNVTVKKVFEWEGRFGRRKAWMETNQGDARLQVLMAGVFEFIGAL